MWWGGRTFTRMFVGSGSWADTLDAGERSGALEMQVMSALVGSAPVLRCMRGGLNPNTVILGGHACSMDPIATGLSPE